jgi:macrodomain Ter protein organizer (MatP/YcbG family)
MQDPTQLTLLLESLHSRDISFSQKDLQKALDLQSDPTIETWIDEHLGPETLLTKEELSL